MVWKEIALIVKSKAHLTDEGLQKIKDIKLNLNIKD